VFLTLLIQRQILSQRGVLLIVDEVADRLWPHFLPVDHDISRLMTCKAWLGESNGGLGHW